MKRKTIGEVMNPVRYTVGARTPVTEALAIMRKGNVRHLPVLDIKGQVVGVISDRDINLACSLPTRSCMVVDAMSPDPYVVHKDRPLQDVISEMTSYKYGSTVVIDDLGNACGIFTTVDALIVLQNYVRKNEEVLDSFHFS
jgi:acetoin utilization protein AcuB